jgi:hypothetical protein
VNIPASKTIKFCVVTLLTCLSALTLQAQMLLPGPPITVDDPLPEKSPQVTLAAETVSIPGAAAGTPVAPSKPKFDLFWNNGLYIKSKGGDFS